MTANVTWSDISSQAGGAWPFNINSERSSRPFEPQPAFPFRTPRPSLFPFLPPIIMKSSPAVVAAALLLAFPSSSLGYTWNFKSTPTQCGQLTIAINGQGKPPYSVLLLPSGPTPFPNGVEIRTIVEEKSSGDSSEITFQLKYPAESQFVAVVSRVHFTGRTWHSRAMDWMDKCFGFGDQINA